ncbi:hypothetical protein [Deinococcus multiflagellatus]|uniref:hypothetical protein n=1 Tax=Deinococcus multiflagellatus TaxID=1656887 RepID=UPI001CCD95D7|nr:hypothetical protein [Deinococcus multiflagellatus]MBZ9713763.1 hypothetical protein [Deinococcus multiflagellatus]
MPSPAKPRKPVAKRPPPPQAPTTAATKKEKSKKDRRRSGAKPQEDKRVKHDWLAIRREYIRGEDAVTLATLADKPGAPSLRQIERRSSEEDWPELRLQMRREVDGRLRAADLDMKTEVRRRQLKIGTALTTLGVQGMAHQKPEEMDMLDVARAIKIGTDLERKALGMEELNVNLRGIKSPEDLDKLGEAALWQLAAMLPPEDENDDDF